MTTKVLKSAAGTRVTPVQLPGFEAQGYALAQSAVGLAKSHANDWHRIVCRLYVLSPEAREAFRTELNKHKKDMQAHVDAQTGKKAVAIWGGAKSSAIVRFSQLKRISEALDAGMSLPVKQDAIKAEGGRIERDPLLADPFHTIVSKARLHLGAKASGRKVATFIEKLDTLVESADPDVAELKAAIKALQTKLAEIAK